METYIFFAPGRYSLEDKRILDREIDQLCDIGFLQTDRDTVKSYRKFDHFQRIIVVNNTQHPFEYTLWDNGIENKDKYSPIIKRNYTSEELIQRDPRSNLEKEVLEEIPTL